MLKILSYPETIPNSAIGLVQIKNQIKVTILISFKSECCLIYDYRIKNIDLKPKLYKQICNIMSASHDLVVLNNLDELPPWRQRHHKKYMEWAINHYGLLFMRDMFW